MKRRLVATACFAWIGCLLLGAAAGATGQDNPALPGFRADASDARAIEIADETMRAMGGRAAWDATRYLSWLFFGRRTHYWDKWTGDVRIESDSTVVLMNVNTRAGRAWVGGREVVEPAAKTKLLESGYGWWVNDGYWMFMPYKLKDTGVALKYRGERAMQDGRQADVLELTFANVGLTPDNRYEVLVDKQTRLVGEWTFYRAATDSAATFTMPWKDWRRVGSIMLCADHGREADWKLAAYESLPRSVFERPDPVRLQ
jgi:hypothetical protein